MHQSSLDKMSAFRKKYLQGRESQPLVILDLGSQNIGGCYRGIFDSPNWIYKGLDLDPGDNVDVILKEPYHWQEIPSNSADVLVSGQAFEHIEYFWVTMAEIARVLKPGGMCCIVAPSSGHEHRYPVDCWRFYPDGFSALARYADLDVLEAFTCWNESSYTDGSNEWQDSVLIAQKPFASVKVSQLPVRSKSFVPDYALDAKIYPAPKAGSIHELPEHESLKKQLNLVQPGQAVIDFGCSTGYLAQFLKQMDCKVVGVELNPGAAALAETHCDEVLVADLDTVDLAALLGDRKFDVAVFGDVLEHLRDPWRVLNAVHQVLKPDGCVVASIPNIAHGAIRLALLQGRFDYAEMGLLDHTHLRFFTRSTVEQLFEATGFFIEVLDRTVVPIFADSPAFAKVDRKDFDPKLLTQLQADPDSETLQFVVRARPQALQTDEAYQKSWRDEIQETVDRLKQDLAQVQEDRVRLVQLKSQLEQERSQLQLHFEQERSRLEQERSQLTDALHHAQDIVIEREQMIHSMMNTKFWKVRKAWVRLKQALMGG